MQLLRTCLTIALACICASSLALGGTIDLEWDPVSYADLAGYRIYYGTFPGGYSARQEVGNATSATLSGLENCTEYFVAVKAIDIDGDVSVDFSNELSGYPRPIVSAASPALVEQGDSIELEITGMNFRDGATVEFDDPGISLDSVTVDSCARLRASITVGASAIAGPVDLTVRNSDQVFGAAAGLLTILPVSGPGVLAVIPESLVEDAPVATRPAVTFTRIMDPATITSASVALLDIAGNPVDQSEGSPSISTDGRTVTIIPAGDLAYRTGYRIRVLGGAGGVQDAGGSAMVSDFVQIPGFTTRRDTSGLPTIVSVRPASMSVGVPVGVQPTITFSQAMDRSSLNATSVVLLDIDGIPVPQAYGSPSVSADGLAATIVPAGDLESNRGYRIVVLGGDGGVRDLSGAPLEATFIQIPGFTTSFGTSAPFRVLAVEPADSTTGVPVTVQPTVTFGPPARGESITPATVALIDVLGNEVNQAAGSPWLSLDGSTATLVPAEPLRFSSGYRIRVLGGELGVRDESGRWLGRTFLQAASFQTVPDLAGPPQVTSVSPPDLAVSVHRNVRPMIRFTEPMDPASLTPASVRLVDEAGNAVPQALGSPALSSGGTWVVIIPAANLDPGATYRVRVRGGSLGVWDLSGDPLPATYTQADGFTTLDSP